VSETRRYLGLELAGAKNQKTALAALEYYPKERKIFLLDIFERIATHAHPNEAGHAASQGAHASGFTTLADEALLELIAELREDSAPRPTRGRGHGHNAAHSQGGVIMGVNEPLELPPCISCARKSCPKPAACNVAAIKWMKEAQRKAERAGRNDPRIPRATEYTTYTQRPVELWIRYSVLNRLPDTHRFEIDETLGGNKAPLTARMHFLRRHLGDLPLYEAWPKLTIALLALDLELPKRIVQSYRRLEEGVHAREQILETLAQRHDVFVYERDVRKLSHSLPAFDAFICAYTAFLADTGRCAKIPSGFPAASGWVQYPEC
jgi:hypothetical protein